MEITAADRTRTGGVASRLAVGTRLTRRELLAPGVDVIENRAAQALCRSYTGGEAACLEAMNARAQGLGMTHAHFEDATGLSERNVASPNDLAKLVMAANREELIREFSTTPEYAVRVGRQLLQFHNTDPLVHDPDWQVSVQKTGHIAAAGQLPGTAGADRRPERGHRAAELLGQVHARGRCAPASASGWRRWSLPSLESPQARPGPDRPDAQASARQRPRRQRRVDEAAPPRSTQRSADGFMYEQPANDSGRSRIRRRERPRCGLDRRASSCAPSESSRCRPNGMR